MAPYPKPAEGSWTEHYPDVGRVEDLPRKGTNHSIHDHRDTHARYRRERCTR